MNFQTTLINAINTKKSVLVVGLDPNLEYFPDYLLKDISDCEKCADSIFEFNKIIIDTVYENCVAIKPQLAYYEVFGSYGLKALENTILYAKEKGLLVINDAKRGDIGSTCDAYAKAFLADSPYAADAVTVNPYLGSDSIIPFIKQADANNKGLFVLVKTSNPSSSDIQDIETKNGKALYIEVADMVNKLIKNNDGYSNIGVVVGATYPHEAGTIKKILTKCFFLVPGYGAQGASGKDLVDYYDNEGLGALISSSRGIIYPYLNTSLNKASITEIELRNMVGSAVKEANEDINKFRIK